MKTLIYNFLRSIGWLKTFYHALLSLLHICLVLSLRLRYKFLIRRTKTRFAKRKLKVCLLAGNLSKWKCQSLYDLMSASEKFDPLVVIAPMEFEIRMRGDEARIWLDATRRYFENCGCKYVVKYDVETCQPLPLDDLEPDLVIYTQPYAIAKTQSPLRVSRTALTCYVPYFVQNYGYLPLDCELPFHREVWRHFALNEQWATIFNEDQGWYRAGESVGTGHPMLDQFIGASEGERKYVIYAPHWSCNLMLRYSTFLENGHQILEYAKKHPDLNWVFKPHPNLRKILAPCCGWTKGEIDDYYGEWEKFAVPCYDSDYVKLFMQSKAMITDCASFLVEYPCSGRPIIHLIASNPKFEPHPIAQKLFSAYYQVRNYDELPCLIDEVVVKGGDPKRQERMSAVKEMKLASSSAAKNILDYLESQFK